MRSSLTVVIPTLNEERHVADAIESAWSAGAFEVIVADGGSDDATCAIAAAHRARVVHAPPGRGVQLNAGARAATGDTLLFLHADTRLPQSAAADVMVALTAGSVFGGFRLCFAEARWTLQIAAALINLRTRVTRCPWGDQAQFISRRTFEQEHGFREIPLMEDYELAVRMKRTYNRSVVLSVRVITSGRRFLRLGIVRTAWRNWSIIRRFRRGADPAELARAYRQ